MTNLITYTTMGADIMAAIAPAMAPAMVVAGAILATTIGWKLLKRFAK